MRLLHETKLEEDFAGLLGTIPSQPLPTARPLPSPPMHLTCHISNELPPSQSMPSADNDLSLSLFSVTCAGVFGGNRDRQEFMSPPTPVAPHIRGHPPGDIVYGMYPVQCIHVCVCVLHMCVYTALGCMWLHVCQFAHHWHSYFNTLFKESCQISYKPS